MTGLTATAATTAYGSTGSTALEAGRLLLDGAQVDGCGHDAAFALGGRGEAGGGWV